MGEHAGSLREREVNEIATLPVVSGKLAERCRTTPTS
jgi:hypothetical protein